MRRVLFGISSEKLLAGVAVILSGTVSAVVTYNVTKRRLDKEYRAIVDREIIEARRFYSTSHKRGAVEPSKSVMRPADAQYETLIDQYSPVPATDGRIFYNKIEIAPRGTDGIVRDKIHIPVLADKDTPYIITSDEFYDSHFAQNTLTYYELDDVLTDEDDMPIDDINRTVGTDNLSRFGENPNDANVIHIRNTRIDVDFEVIRNPGSYAEIVLGVDSGSNRKNNELKDE